MNQKLSEKIFCLKNIKINLLSFSLKSSEAVVWRCSAVTVVLKNFGNSQK